MKTLKTLLVIAAATMTVSVFAGDATQDPNLIAGPRLGKNTPDVVLANPSSGYQAPDATPRNFAGKRTVEARVTASAAQNENTLAGTKCQGMPSKAKDTAACAQHCAKMAKQ